MPNWRKLIVSGSDAHLNSLNVNTFISASEFVGGDFIGDGSQLINVSASYLSNELTASISGSITAFSSSISGRVELLEVTGSDHESRLDTLEGKTLVSSSAQIAGDISGSFTSLSSSFEQRITSNEGSIISLNSATSSYLLNTTDTLDGDLTVTGKITAQEFHTEFVSASIIFQSGSTKFGDTSDDIHSFTGSVNISGSISADNLVGIISSSAQIAAEISGSFTSVSQSIAADIEDIIDGTTTVASSSYALTASYAENVPETASYALNSLSSSYAVTASYAINAGAGLGFPFSGSAVITGSLYVSQSTISGSFVGDGSGIEGVVSSSYAVTASYALNAGGADTGSLLTTASAAGTTITFEKGDGTTFDVSITSDVTPANALVTASIAGSTLTFEKGDTSTFNITLPAGGYSGSNATAHLYQTIAASTWSFAHNLDDRYPVFTIYDNGGDIIVPNRVETVDKDNANIYFTTARTGTATAVIASSISQIASITADFTNQTSVAVTHSLDTRNIHVSVYDTNYSLVVPESITLDTLDTVVVTFPTAQSGTVVVAQGGHIISGSLPWENISNIPAGILSGSEQIASDISGSFASLSSSLEQRVTLNEATGSDQETRLDTLEGKTLISSSLQFNSLTTPFTGSFTGSFYGDGSNLSGVTSYTDADTLSFIQGYSGSYSGSFIGDGSQLSGVTSYTDADTLAYINSLAVVSGSSITGSFTGSFFGDGTGLTGLGYGDTKKLNQTVAATTWSFNHNMNEQYPTVTVYNDNNEVVQPSKIEAVSNSTLNLYFGIPTAGTAVAVVGGVALTQEAGFNRVFTQGAAATTWSFAHNLGQKYPQFEVYDSNDELIIPGKVQAVDQNNAILYFDTPQAGTVAATVGGTAMTASYADTLTIIDTLLTTQKNTDVDTGTETVATVSTSLYDGAFFDYVLKDGTSYRAGTVMAVWDGTSIQFSETSTADIGNTNSVSMSVDISGTDARLRASVGSDNWNIKAFVRAL